MKVIISAILIFAFNFATAQEFQNEFKAAYQSNDTLKQAQILASWEKKNPRDPELYTSYYNYYFNRSGSEILSLTSDKPRGESLALQDSLDNTAGYFGSSKHYNEVILKEAFKKIDKGIELHPNRLDMRFGKIYGLGEIESWDVFTDEIIKTIKYSKVNNNAWLWTNDVARDDAKEFFLSSLQGY